MVARSGLLRRIRLLSLVLFVASFAIAGIEACSETAPRKALEDSEIDRSDLSRFARRRASGAPDRVFRIGEYRLEFFDRNWGTDTPLDASPERIDSFLYIEREYSDTHFVLGALAIKFHHRRENRDRRAGHPDLIAETWSGGAHCCFTTFVITLGDTFAVDTLETDDGSISVDLDRFGGPPRVNFPDTAFAYWNASYGASPAPTVHLTWVDGSYALDVPRMRRSAWTAAELDAAVAEVTKELAEWNGAYEACPENFEIHCHIGHRPPSTQPPSILWDRLLERIYSGNSRDAITLFEASWPVPLKGRRAFWNDFKRRLVSSKIWKRFAIGQLLGARPVLEY